MVAADQTFINEMLRMANFENIFANRVRYPQITAEKLAAAKPDVILLSSEPFPFKEKHVREMQSICPAAKVEIVDGELFSWYGNRLLLAAPYFEKLRLKLKLDSTKKLSKN